MHWDTLSEEPCPIARFLAAVGDRWSLLLVRQAFLGDSRYEEFRKSVGLSPTVLKRRLDHLCDQGVFERVVDEARPKRPAYRLTASGLGLWRVVLSIVHWGETSAPNGRESEWSIVHTGCGSDLAPQPEFGCSSCGEPVSLAELRIHRRPASPEASGPAAGRLD